MLDFSLISTSALATSLPPRVKLYGPPGTGKTHSLRTLLDAGLEVFCILTEAHSTSVLSDVPPEKFHWKYIPGNAADFESLLRYGEIVRSSSYEALTQMKGGLLKGADLQWDTFVRSLIDFTCDRTGKSYGPVNLFGPDKVLVIDSLSGLNNMATKNTVGYKPVPNPGEYRVMQETLRDMIDAMCLGLKCGLVVTGHPDRVHDDVTQASMIYMATIGSKLTPLMGKNFSDIIVTGKDFDKGIQTFWWDNAQSGYETKANNILPGRHEPTFLPLWENWYAKLTKKESEM